MAEKYPERERKMNFTQVWCPIEEHCRVEMGTTNMGNCHLNVPLRKGAGSQGNCVLMSRLKPARDAALHWLKMDFMDLDQKSAYCSKF